MIGHNIKFWCDLSHRYIIGKVHAENLMYLYVKSGTRKYAVSIYSDWKVL